MGSEMCIRDSYTADMELINVLGDDVLAFQLPGTAPRTGFLVWPADADHRLIDITAPCLVHAAEEFNGGWRCKISKAETFTRSEFAQLLDVLMTLVNPHYGLLYHRFDHDHVLEIAALLFNQEQRLRDEQVQISRLLGDVVHALLNRPNQPESTSTLADKLGVSQSKIEHIKKARRP